MWMPRAMFNLFSISKDTVDGQREELAALRTERDLLKTDLLTTKANFDWARVRVNSLEMERAQLLDRLYGLKVPVPEVMRTNPQRSSVETMNSFSFEDVGDAVAKDLGLPVWNS